MKMSKIAILVLIVALFVVSTYFYQILPEKIASHWGVSGDANGYSSKAFGLFFIPVLTLILTLIFLVIPKIDPLKKNIKKFENHYFGFIIVFILFMCLVQAQIILWNLSVKINPNIVFPIGIAALFFYIALLMRVVKRNWFIGIRTPWTLASDRVWDKTHALGSKLFFISGIFSLAGIFFREFSWLFIIIPVLISALISIIYSYLIYRKLKL
ncbi:MAG: SdpI family protein [Candidatus Pacearchaeota archaeon]